MAPPNNGVDLLREVDRIPEWSIAQREKQQNLQPGFYRIREAPPQYLMSRTDVVGVLVWTSGVIVLLYLFGG